MIDWLRTHRAEMVRTGIGIAGFGLVVVGVWGLWGWQWAAMLAGAPVGGLYLYGEIRAARQPAAREELT